MNNAQNGTVKFSNTGKDTYQADYVGAPITVAPGSVGTNTVKMFAGAKEIKLLDNYTKQFNIPKFDLAVDFGWYYFLTKPFSIFSISFTTSSETWAGPFSCLPPCSVF